MTSTPTGRDPDRRPNAADDNGPGFVGDKDAALDTIDYRGDTAAGRARAQAHDSDSERVPMSTALASPPADGRGPDTMGLTGVGNDAAHGGQRPGGDTDLGAGLDGITAASARAASDRDTADGRPRGSA